jgi:4-amino-4-deoxy-L-arabinose transferase-like glycosyltransferase
LQFIKNNKTLVLLLVVYLFTVFYYAVSTPLYEVSDELWHYPTVRYLAQNDLALPPQETSIITDWRQQGSQPPLYHILAAILTAGIDTSDYEQVRRINPHADIGIVTPDKNHNAIIHNWEREQFPWQGTALATYVARFFSATLSIFTVIVSYYTAKTIFPNQPALAIGTAGVNAFLPMFLFISGGVNNDNLSNLMGNLLILLLLLSLKNWRTINTQYYVAIGIVTGAGILSKLSIGFAIPVVVVALLIIALRRKDWRPFIIGGAISGGLTILIAGWWYWRNYQLYGDPTGLNRFLDIVGRRSVPADLYQLWLEAESFLHAFWGLFGGMSVPFPAPIYIVLNLFGAFGLLSAVVYLIRQIVLKKWDKDQWLLVFITLLWIIVNFVSYLQWTSITWASQGRLIFVALSSILMWMIWGYLWFIPQRFHKPIVGGIVGGFFCLAIYAQFGVIRPNYAPAQPISVEDSQYQTTFTAQNNDAVNIYQSSMINASVFPSEYVLMEVDMQVDTPPTLNWSIFIHLKTQDGVIIAQRDIYPNPKQGQAFYISEVETGFAWSNFFAIYVPTTVYTPLTLDVVMGIYHLDTGERMLTPEGEDHLLIGQVELLPRENALNIPNYIDVNFKNGIKLLGYELNSLAPRPNDTVTLTLYWQTQKPIEQDWVVFANIIEPHTLTKFADSNAMPVDWTRPTTSWEVGEIIVDTHQLTVYPDALPGIYEIEVGMFVQKPDGSFENLTVRNTNNKLVHLSRVRILPAE